jgi:DNA-binding response OmpR family regulator
MRAAYGPEVRAIAYPSGPVSVEVPAIAKILVVDDDPSIRMLLNVVLSEEGHEVIEASDGVEGCEAFDLAGDVDCLVLDVMMPRLDGYGVLEALRQHPTNPDVAIIMLTAKGGELEEAKGWLAGCDGYVTKPFDPEVLAGLIDVTLMYSSKDRAASRVKNRAEWLSTDGI